MSHGKAHLRAEAVVEPNAELNQDPWSFEGWQKWTRLPQQIRLDNFSVTMLREIRLSYGRATVVLSGLGDLLFPERCRACRAWAASIPRQRKAVTTSVCSTCWQSIAGGQPLVEWCYLADGTALKIVSGAPYQGALKQLIYKLKYDGDRLIANDLGRLIVGLISLVIPDLKNTPLVIVPVPLHNERLKSRGFNQAELIAQEVAHELQIRLSTRALKRVKPTQPQHGLNRRERHVNLEGAFRGDAKRLAGKAVVLVDDIHTSGATLLEAAREVLSKGATTVVALTVARALWSHRVVDPHSSSVAEVTQDM